MTTVLGPHDRWNVHREKTNEQKPTLYPKSIINLACVFLSVSLCVQVPYTNAEVRGHLWKLYPNSIINPECVCLWKCVCVNVEAREQPWMLVFVFSPWDRVFVVCLHQGILFTSFWDSLVSVTISYCIIHTWYINIYTEPSFTWLLDIPTQVLIPVWQTLHLLICPPSRSPCL